MNITADIRWFEDFSDSNYENKCLTRRKVKGLLRHVLRLIKYGR